MSVVAAIIEREIELTSRFVAALNEEQEVLKQGNADALAELTANKNLLIEQLNSLETERINAVGISGAEPVRGAMEKWLALHGSDKAAAVNWEKLLNFAREAKALHELNSQLVELHLRKTSEILHILTHQPEKQMLYGNTGQTVSATGSRIVDSA